MFILNSKGNARIHFVRAGKNLGWREELVEKLESK